MAVSSATIGANASAQISFGNSYVSFPLGVSQTFSGGATTTGYVDQVYVKAASITSGSPLTLDLSGSLTQPDGTSFVVVKLVGLLIKNTSSSGYLTIGGGSNPIAGITGFAGPLGFFALSNDSGMTVTAGTGDILQIAASSGTVTAEIILISRSA